MKRGREKHYILKNYSDLDGIVYAVTRSGRVWSSSAGYLDCMVTREGYLYISMTDPSGQQIYRYAHRLVWEAINGPIPSNREINHKDLQKQNNCIDNLELVTHKRNINHARNAKIWSSVAKKTIVEDTTTGEITVYPTRTHASNAIRRSTPAITKAIRSGHLLAKKYRITCGGAYSGTADNIKEATNASA